MVALNYSAQSQEESSQKASDMIEVCFSEMGKDTSCALNGCESRFLNMFYQKLRGRFDFTGKRVAFFTDNLGTTRISKVEYFNLIKARLSNAIVVDSIVDSSWQEYPDRTMLYVFEKDDAKQVGYDAVVFANSILKGVLSKKEVIRRLHPGKGLVYLFSRLSYWL